MESNRRQLKVVPPQNIKPLTQPVKQPLPDSSEVKDHKNIPDSSQDNPKSKPKFFLNRIMILGILAGLGYGLFVPKIPYDVKADARISTRDYKRQTISLPEAGIVKEIKVKPNQDVSVGDVIIEAESENIKNDIAQKKADLGRIASDLKNDVNAINQAQISLNQERVKTQSAQDELELALKDLRSFNAGILPQRYQIELEKIELKNQIDIKQEELKRVENRLARYYKAIEQNAISRDMANDIEIQQGRLKGEITQINDRLKQNETKIAAGNKELNDQVQKLKSRLKEQRSQEQSAFNHLSSLQEQIQQSKDRITIQESEIKRQEERQKSLVVKSGIQGTVLDSDLDQFRNRFYQAGEKVIEIADLSNLKVIILVRQEDFDLVKIGNEVKFYPSGTLKPYIARVESISNIPIKKDNDPKPYWEVTFSIKNDSRRSLKPEMSGYVSIQTQSMTLFEKMRHEVLKLVRRPMI